MPPPKGVSKSPYGPCANAACPNGLCVLVECGCRCGYSGTEDVPRHNIFHPDCCALHPTDSCLFNPGKDSPWPVSADSTIDAIALGRQLGDPKYYDDHAMTGHSGSPDRRWRSINGTMAETTGLQLLPDNAVLCQDCWARFANMKQTDSGAREHIDEIIRACAHLLPDRTAHSLAAALTLQHWLGGALRRSVWSTAGFRIRRDSESKIQKTVAFSSESNDTGGIVTCGGHAGTFRAVLKPVIVWVVQLCGFNSHQVDQRNRLGCQTAISLLSEMFGSVFWAMIGRHLHGVVSASTPERLARIRSRALTVVTPCKSDFETMPAELTTTLTNLAAGSRDLEQARSRSRSRSESQRVAGPAHWPDCTRADEWTDEPVLA